MVPLVSSCIEAASCSLSFIFCSSCSPLIPIHNHFQILLSIGSSYMNNRPTFFPKSMRSNIGNITRTNVCYWDCHGIHHSSYSVVKLRKTIRILTVGRKEWLPCTWHPLHSLTKITIQNSHAWTPVAQARPLLIWRPEPLPDEIPPSS